MELNEMYSDDKPPTLTVETSETKPEASHYMSLIKSRDDSSSDASTYEPLKLKPRKGPHATHVNLELLEEPMESHYQPLIITKGKITKDPAKSEYQSLNVTSST